MTSGRMARKTGAMLTPLIQVAIGGALGASARYLATAGMSRIIGHGFPWGTLMVNVVGSFLMGVLMVFLAKKGGDAYAPLLVVGILGGFTTFSAFSLDALSLYERGQVALAGAYVAGSVILSLTAIVAGGMAARMALT